MAGLLLVDDDAVQLGLRRMLLENAGHDVRTAERAEATCQLFREAAPDIVVLDLRLPRPEDGLALIRELRALSSSVRILVLSGWLADLDEAPEAKLVDAVLRKPARTEQLLATIAKLTLLFACLLALRPGVARAERVFAFSLNRSAEVVAELEMSAPGADWGREGREASLASLSVDGRPQQDVVLYAGPGAYRYPVFLGRLSAGGHQLRIDRNARYSAPGAGLEIAAAHFREYRAGDSLFPVIANAPVLYARPNTAGEFSDVPLLVYCERLGEAGRSLLQYTVVFSNEDGGTSTRALMARWGRATDIEFVYRVFLDGDRRALIQARDHKLIEFTGRQEVKHPLLYVETDNNMVAPEGASPLRFQIAPLLIDLSTHSREQVMDEHPITYRVMALELRREGKLRPFGTVDSEKISNPRNYLYLEAKLDHRNAALAALVRLDGEHRWRSSNLGRADYAVSRDGWVRTTVELPTGTRPEQLAEIAFQCLNLPEKDKPPAPAGMCRIDALTKVFFLDSDYRPGPSFWTLPSDPAGLAIPTGEMRSFPVMLVPAHLHR